MRRFVLLVLVVFAVAGCGSAATPPPGLLFVSTRDGDYAIFGVAAGGGHEHRVTKGRGDPSSPKGLFFAIEPAWSPDGRLVAFVSKRDGVSHVYVMQADGTDVRRLTDARAEDGGPSWSPDGRRIAFAREGALFWVVRADGRHARQVTKLRALGGFPSWSPDGRRLAFQSNARGGHFEIYSIALAGTGLRRETRSSIDTIEPAWSPDGKEIAFSRDGAIWTVDRDGHERKLTSGENDSAPVWRPGAQD